MEPMNDHDLLIQIATTQQEMRADMRSMSDTMALMQRSLDATNQRQGDLEHRVTNLSGTVQRQLADQNDDRREMEAIETRLLKDIDSIGGQVRDIKSDIDRWKIYGKVAAVLLSPLYLIVMYAAEQALKAWLWP